MTCAELDYWPCSVLGREGFTYGPILAQFLNQSWSGDQVINQSWSGYLVTFTARARFRIRCILGESKLQPTLNAWFVLLFLASQLLCLFSSISTCPDTLMIRLIQNMTQRNVTNNAYIHSSAMIITFHAEILSSPSSKKRKGMRWSEAPMSGNYTRERCSQDRNSDDKNTHVVESGHMAVLHKLQITTQKNIWQVPLHWTGGLRVVRRGREWLVHHSMLKWPSVQWDVQGGYSHKLKEELLLEWVAMPFSSRPSWPRDQTHVSYVSCMSSQVLYR